MKPLVRLLSIPLIAFFFAGPVAYAQQDDADFSQAELDQMLAPIALYPDVLLSQILMASTYPLEIVEAARWSRNNPGLEGEQAVEAVADQDWDPSVKALVAFPQVLERMYDDLNWTTSLGDAFLYQEAQVMDTVQGLRQRAHEAGNLESTGNVRVVREQEIIVIEPVHPRVVYVPYYNPRVIYGPWWWSAYPPVYWGPPPGYFVSTGFFWGSGVHVSLGFFFSTFDWHRRHVTVVHHHHLHHFPRSKTVKHIHHHHRHHIKHHGHKWRHNPKHRRGVAYRHASVQREYGHHRSARSGYSRSSQWSGSSRRGDIDSRRGSANRDGQMSSVVGRTDDRRLAGRTDSRNLTRGDSDRRSSFNRTPGSDHGDRRSAGFNRDRDGDSRRHAFNRSSDTDTSRSERGSNARAEGSSRFNRSEAGVRTRGQGTDTAGRTTTDSAHNRASGRAQSQAADARRSTTQGQRPERSTRGGSSFGFNLGQQPNRTGAAIGQANTQQHSQAPGNRRATGNTATGHQGLNRGQQARPQQHSAPSRAATTSRHQGLNRGQQARPQQHSAPSRAATTSRHQGSSRSQQARSQQRSVPSPTATTSQSRSPAAAMNRSSGNRAMAGQHQRPSAGSGSMRSGQPSRSAAASRGMSSRTPSVSSPGRSASSGITGGQRSSAGSITGGGGQSGFSRGGSQGQRSSGMSGRSRGFSGR